MASSPPKPRKIHPVSQAGFGAGKSELYDKMRPSYAPEVLLHIRKAVSRKEGLKIVEIGSGSGIFTRALLAHPEWRSSISEIRCIDPNDGMRVVFEKTVKDPRVSLAEGTFLETGVPDCWADLIVSASAFHWCTELDEAIAEFIRILNSDGVISFLWNLQDAKNFAWIKQLDELCLPYHEGSASSQENFNKWRQLFDLPSYRDNFLEPEEVLITSTELRTLESLTLHAFTRGPIAILGDDEKEKVRHGIKEIVLRGDDLVWANKKEGIMEVPYATPVVMMRRRSLR